MRVLVAIMLLGVGVFTGLTGLILGRYGSWSTIAAMILLVEPLALACGAGAVFMFIPTPSLGRALIHVIPRILAALLFLFVLVVLASATGAINR